MEVSFLTVPPNDPIQTLLDREDWPAARRLILRDLRKTPDSHWLLDRLALTYYEQHRYTRALRVGRRARELAPRCPMVLFNLAGALEMTGQPRSAIRIWRGLLRRPLRRLAWGTCGEGLRAARAIRNECRFRIAKALFHLGEFSLARLYLESHLRHRRPRHPLHLPQARRPPSPLPPPAVAVAPHSLPLPPPCRNIFAITGKPRFSANFFPLFPP